MGKQKEVAVYFFMGFLESGKTKFIQETLEDERMDSGEKTLLLITEEGETEYVPERFKVRSVEIATLRDKSELTQEKLSALEKESGADRVLVEYNGTWLLQDFFDAMPENWSINQMMSFFDSKTFLSYNANMRQLVYDKIYMTQMAVFNRFPEDGRKEDFHKIVRSISRQVDIVYERADGKAEFDDIVDPLPFDVNAPVIEIEDRDFAYFYRDLSENTGAYDGKTVRLKGVVATSRKLPENHFVLGRHIMTCCAADIQYNGFACILEKPFPLETKDWAIVKAKISVQNHSLYKNKGPVLLVETIEKCAPLEGEEQVCTFY